MDNDTPTHTLFIHSVICVYLDVFIHEDALIYVLPAVTLVSCLYTGYLFNAFIQWHTPKTVTSESNLYWTKKNTPSTS